MPTYRVSRAILLQTSCCLLALGAFTSSAWAQDGGLETVVVTGEKFALQKAIDDKRDANVVSDGMAADDIGAIPEFGLGDALRKVPGLALQINNGRGEDEFLTMRGLNPDYNTITIDGMPLPSTEETRASVSLDDPAVRSGQPGRCREELDGGSAQRRHRRRHRTEHPQRLRPAGRTSSMPISTVPIGTTTEQVTVALPSGQGDLTYSNTFGANDEFGIVVLGSYIQRSSSTLNTYTLGYSYYPYSRQRHCANVPALEQSQRHRDHHHPEAQRQRRRRLAIPDRHRWYFYDNDRTRPGVFSRLDFNDHSMFHADVAGGLFEFINDENRYSQYLNRVGNATITTSTTGSFAAGRA